jgi:hypothetical protein
MGGWVSGLNLCLHHLLKSSSMPQPTTKGKYEVRVFYIGLRRINVLDD